MSTYIRKYYLHRRVKEAGFRMKLEQCHKTIFVPTEKVEAAAANKHLKELRDKHQYGVQTEMV